MALTATAISQDQNVMMQEILHDWAHWIATRRFYAPYMPMNILARLQGGSGLGREPNARNIPICAAWNLVMQQAHNAEPEHLLPFLYVYMKSYRPTPIKTLAFYLGIDGDTVYQRAHAAAPKYLRQARDLEELSAKMQKEVAGHH